MEAKLQKRLDSQPESIDLQLKLFLLEADGAGFFRTPGSIESSDAAEGPAAENRRIHRMIRESPFAEGTWRAVQEFLKTRLHMPDQEAEEVAERMRRSRLQESDVRDVARKIELAEEKVPETDGATTRRGPVGEGGIYGSWKVIEMSRNGRSAPPMIIQAAGYFIDSKTLVPTVNGTVRADDAVAWELNESVRPKQIDLTELDSGETSLGIFDLAGDRLRICFASPGDERPRSFESNEGATLMVLERVKHGKETDLSQKPLVRPR
jgi:uncharacterized protein (TIGR03067 family)